MNGIRAFIKETRESSLIPLPCENTAKTQLSPNQEAGSQKIPNLLTP